ncbi:MAG: hypothetical protein WEA99_14935 [Brumimicrobium sp.]
MNKIQGIIILLLFITTVSCNNENTLCDCVKAGKQVDKISASFFNRDYSVKGKDSLDRAIHARDSVCEPFKNMSPEKLSEASKNCEVLEIEVNEQ